MRLPIPPDPGTLHMHGQVLHRAHAYTVIAGTAMLLGFAAYSIANAQPSPTLPAVPAPNYHQPLPDEGPTVTECQQLSPTESICYVLPLGAFLP